MLIKISLHESRWCAFHLVNTLSVCGHVMQQARMYTAGNLGRGRRKQPTPEVDVHAAVRMRRTALPARLCQRRLSRAGVKEIEGPRDAVERSPMN